MNINGIPVARLADLLDARAETMTGKSHIRDRRVMRAAVRYIRFLEEQLVEEQASQQTPPRPQRPTSTPLSQFIDQQVVDQKPGMVTRRVTFR